MAWREGAGLGGQGEPRASSGTHCAAPSVWTTSRGETKGPPGAAPGSNCEVQRSPGGCPLGPAGGRAVRPLRGVDGESPGLRGCPLSPPPACPELGPFSGGIWVRSGSGPLGGWEGTEMGEVPGARAGALVPSVEDDAPRRACVSPQSRREARVGEPAQAEAHGEPLPVPRPQCQPEGRQTARAPVLPLPPRFLDFLECGRLLQPEG